MIAPVSSLVEVTSLGHVSKRMVSRSRPSKKVEIKVNGNSIYMKELQQLLTYTDNVISISDQKFAIGTLLLADGTLAKVRVRY